MDHRRHHRHRYLTKAQRKAVRIVQIVAILICVTAIADFGFMAYITKDCFTGTPGSNVEDEPGPRAPIDSEECRVLIASRDLHMRIDGLAALLAVALFVGAGVALSRTHHRTKKAILATETVALVLFLVYSLLWIYSWH